MSSSNSTRVDQAFLANAMAAFLRIGALVLLLVWCFDIVRPFVSIVIWGVIISVALYPVHRSLTDKLGGREKLSAVLFTLAGLALILVPTFALGESLFVGLRALGEGLRNGTLIIPPPGDKVLDWPLIGETVFEAWTQAATNLENAVVQYAEPLRQAGQHVISIATGTVVGVLQFVFSMIIAGALLMQGKGGFEAARDIMTSLAGKKHGERFTSMSILTVRSVVKGVLGVAVIQAILAAIGLLVIGVPAAGLWAADTDTRANRVLGVFLRGAAAGNRFPRVLVCRQHQRRVFEADAARARHRDADARDPDRRDRRRPVGGHHRPVHRRRDSRVGLRVAGDMDVAG